MSKCGNVIICQSDNKKADVLRGVMRPLGDLKGGKLFRKITFCRFAFGRVFGAQNCQPTTKAQ